MTSHELARALLALPNLPVATHAKDHTYLSNAAVNAAGALKIGRLRTYAGDHVIIGDIGRRQLNPPNWYVTDMFVGQAPDDYPHYIDGQWAFGDALAGAQHGGRGAATQRPVNCASCNNWTRRGDSVIGHCARGISDIPNAPSTTTSSFGCVLHTSEQSRRET